MKGLSMNLFARRKTEIPEINFDIPTINVPRPLSEKARAIVEAGVSEYATMKVELDAANAERQKALDLVNQATSSIKSLQHEIDSLKGRCISYQLERDEAVAKFAKLQGLFTAMQAQLQAFDIPQTAPGPAPVTEKTILPPLDLNGLLSSKKSPVTIPPKGD